MNDRKTCFVIMPFSETSAEHTEEYWTTHFETFLKPLIEGGGDWTARRSTALRGDIIREIISDLVTAHTVVVDLTDSNPNVYWELGVRQSFKHGTLTIAEHGTKLPFDISAKGSLFYYPRNHLKMEEFRRQFSVAMNSCSTEPDRPDSHVLETLSGRGTIYELVRKDEALRRVDALLTEINDGNNCLNKISEIAKGNKQPDAKHRSYTRLMRASCCELLMTTRYLDRDSKFYGLVEAAYETCMAINNQLGIWEQSPSDTDTFLVNNTARYETDLKGLANALIPIRSELEHRI